MSSFLNLEINRIPDGAYMVVLDKADGTRITRESVTFAAYKAKVQLPTTPVGEVVKGYLDDGQLIVLRAAYIESTSTKDFNGIYGNAGTWLDRS